MDEEHGDAPGAIGLHGVDAGWDDLLSGQELELAETPELLAAERLGDRGRRVHLHRHGDSRQTHKVHRGMEFECCGQGPLAPVVQTPSHLQHGGARLPAGAVPFEGSSRAVDERRSADAGGPVAHAQAAHQQPVGRQVGVHVLRRQFRALRTDPHLERARRQSARPIRKVQRAVGAGAVGKCLGQGPVVQLAGHPRASVEALTPRRPIAAGQVKIGVDRRAERAVVGCPASALQQATSELRRVEIVQFRQGEDAFCLASAQAMRCRLTSASSGLSSKPSEQTMAGQNAAGVGAGHGASKSTLVELRVDRIRCRPPGTHGCRAPGEQDHCRQCGGLSPRPRAASGPCSRVRRLLGSLPFWNSLRTRSMPADRARCQGCYCRPSVGLAAGSVPGRPCRSLRRDRDQRQIRVAAGVGQREEEHDGGERAFRVPVAVVNPEPVIAVMHGGKGGRRPVLAAVNPHGVPPVLRGERFRKQAPRCGPSGALRARPDSWRKLP